MFKKFYIPQYNPLKIGVGFVIFDLGIDYIVNDFSI